MWKANAVRVCKGLLLRAVTCSVQNVATQRASANSKQDRQCTCNVTLRRRVRESLLPWKSNKYFISVCVCARVRACSLAHPACKAHAPYCDVICPLLLHHIFRHYLINYTNFWKMLLNIKCVFRLSLQLFFETFLILKRINRAIVINMTTPSCKAPVILVGF
jgi:hypothetical protein